MQSVRPTTPVGHGRYAVFGLLCALGATPAYFVLMDIPLVRSTALPTWLLLVAGCALALFAGWRDRRRWVRWIAGVTVFMLVGSAFAWFVLGSLPKAAAPPAVAAAAPDFTLPDESGQPITLSQESATGPVLLVFYRGFW